MQLLRLASEAESRISKQIQIETAKVAKETHKVAQQTQHDSASMITIATVTLVFLPGTFVSSIMSTTFFNYEGNDLRVSRRWWILLPTILPLTAIVFGIWLGRLYFSRRSWFKRENEVGA